MRRPRRLFTSSGLSARGAQAAGSRTVLIGLLAVGAGTVVVLAGSPGDLFGRVPAPSGILTADAGAVAVVDGETLRLRDTVIRLRGVAAPARGVACPTANGASFDCGREAASALGRMLRGQTVICRLEGRDPRGLPQGRCDAGATQVNRAIVAAGWARAAADAGPSSGDDSLSGEEQQARAAMRGVWQGRRTPVF